MLNSRTRVGLIAPCIGVGGADALMLGLVRYCHNVEFTGCAVLRHSEIKHVDWARKMTGNLIKFHSPQVQYSTPGINYHINEIKAIEAACKGADVILSWCVFNVKGWSPNIDIPIIDYAQNSDEFAEEVITSNKKNKLIYNAACSRSVAEAVYAGRENIPIIYNAVDPGRVTPKKGRQIQRHLWGIPEDKKIILFMGRWVQEKHPLTVLAALAELDDSWIAVLVGEGLEEDIVYRSAQAFCPGRVFLIAPEYHVGDILAAADVFVLPSDFEGHSLALCEAWLSGIPTVYTDIPVNKELTQIHGELGVMIPICPTGKQLAEGIIEACSETKESFKRVANARDVAWNNFTLPTAAGIWEEYFDYVVMDYRKKKRQILIHPVKELEPLCRP